MALESTRQIRNKKTTNKGKYNINEWRHLSGSDCSQSTSKHIYLRSLHGHGHTPHATWRGPSNMERTFHRAIRRQQKSALEGTCTCVQQMLILTGMSVSSCGWLPFSVCCKLACGSHIRWNMAEMRGPEQWQQITNIGTYYCPVETNKESRLDEQWLLVLRHFTS